MDKLEQQQNTMYDKITNKICDNNAFRSSCKESHKIEKTKQFFKEFGIVSEEDLRDIFFEEFNFLFSETGEKSKKDLKEFYANANIIDFKKLQSYIVDCPVCDNENVLTYEELKELVKKLVQAAISTEKLECMICYEETHKIYSNELFWEFYNYLNYKSDPTKALGFLTAKQLNDMKQKSNEYLNQANNSINIKIKKWYDRFYGVIEEFNFSIINWSYNSDEFKADVLKKMNECYYQVPQGQQYVLDKIELKYFENHINTVYDKIYKDHFRVLSRNNKFNKIRNKTAKSLLFFGFVKSFDVNLDDITIPKLIYDEYENAINQVCEHKIIKTNIKSISEYINSPESFILLSNLYVVYIKMYLILSSSKMIFMRRMAYSCKTEGMVYFINSIALKKLSDDERKRIAKFFK